jgi:alpha-glucosidase (family GH31 glycosyl hydrolase)
MRDIYLTMWQRQLVGCYRTTAYLVKDLDVDGFKTDGGEHAWGHDLRYADGRRGDEGNNLFPVGWMSVDGRCFLN